MMCRLFVAGVLWFYALALAAQDLGSSSGPTGVAPYVELGREAFLLGLYVPGGIDSAADAFNNPGSRALVFKFTADRMTAGKLSRVILQSIAINANPRIQRASADSLAAFFNTLKGSLRNSDVLTISEKTDAGGVKVYLNGQTLTDIDDANFFNLLLVSWIGSVPPSTEFKAALLGETAAGDLVRFRQLEPAPERREAVAAWLAPPPAPDPASQVDAEPSVASATEPREETPEQTQGAAAEPSETPGLDTAGDTEKTAQADLAADGETVESASPASDNPPTEDDDTASKTETQAPGETLAESAASESVDIRLSAASVERTPAPPEPEEDLPNFSAASLSVLQDYTAQLVQLTHKEIRYPRRAMKLKQTGSVRMAVVIDASGELVDMQPLLESEFKQLNDAVERAVENAAPYPALPEAIAAEQFEFVFPITFMLES